MLAQALSLTPFALFSTSSLLALTVLYGWFVNISLFSTFRRPVEALRFNASGNEENSATGALKLFVEGCAFKF